MAGRPGCCAVAIMAKAPRVGEVKTRLVPPLSPAEAAALGSCFIQDIASNILAAARDAPIEGYVAYSPPGSEDVFAALLPAGVHLLRPRRVGLGDALFDAAEDLLAAGYGAACLVNADSPTLPTAVLVEAARLLAAPGDRLVLGPAADGGYYLIGLKQPHHRLFADIAWSTERVFRQTLERAGEIGLETIALPGWYDVDDVDSLRQLMWELRGIADRRGYAAPHTAAFLRGLAVEL
ncbi:MAG TPA: TIGR04282 family arsenosugar biosynthesis glycosyltransferase [Stellaceae bacterium]|nr:TIGR04282 family arsenosugar biosynthesis glycosyltransferase [Stellaceae bacterium]